MSFWAKKPTKKIEKVHFKNPRPLKKKDHFEDPALPPLPGSPGHANALRRQRQIHREIVVGGSTSILQITGKFLGKPKGEILPKKGGCIMVRRGQHDPF